MHNLELILFLYELPLKHYYTKKQYAAQNVANQHPLVGLSVSSMNGDIGSLFSRTF
jgi:hypothetical protein